MQPPTPLETYAWAESAAVHGFYQGALIGIVVLTLMAFLAVVIAFGVEAVDGTLKRLKARSK